MKRKIGTAVVVGTGIAGIRAALDLAEYGYGVTLVDRAPNLGGILSQLDHQFPTDHCGMCRMLPLVQRDAASQHCLRRGLFHENIEILLATEITGIEGEPGKLRVTLKQQPPWVDPERCVGCGLCPPVCPVEIADEFNAGLARRKAIYLPVPHSIPNAYVLDAAACTRCGACIQVCPTGAIRMPEAERKKFRVLVVDDELVVRDSLKEWLEVEGFTAAMAVSGPEALAALEAESYHLMLLDIKMPGMDGVEVLERAKRLSPALAVIMMTAYATVETAVEAMKIGAMDYLVKPFEVDRLIPKVVQIFQRLEAAEARQIETGAVVWCGGTALYNPSRDKNPFGYGVAPGVLTQIEFERLLSGTGPTGGRLIRPGDGQAVRRVAWIQCVGSRDVQVDADFCSNICCMVSVKEALLAKARAEGDLEATIFFMDMRTFGKTFQRYRDAAEHDRGVRFIRSRPHSLEWGPAGAGLAVRWVDSSGASQAETFDLVVLAVGQRPALGSAELADKLELPLNPWGFIEAEPFSMSRTRNPGFFIGGAFSGMKDIGEAVIQASSAAVNASRVIHSAGGSLALEEPRLGEGLPESLSREAPCISALICRCGRAEAGQPPEFLARALRSDPAVTAVETVENLCTSAGWEQLAACARKAGGNRLLIGACLPCAHQRKVRELGRELGIDAALIEVVDIAPWSVAPETDSAAAALVQLRSGIAKLKWVEPHPAAEIQVTPRALVVGGGVAGMTAALAIADHGYSVELVEAGERLGGNLTWLSRSLEGHDFRALLENILKRVEKHPRIQVHTRSRVVQARGEVGAFTSVIEGPDHRVRHLEHGVVILATGGTEAPAREFAWGQSPAVMTQSEVERQLADGRLDANKLDTVVMIQCVGSRQEPRNYCSRVCCATALKQAFAIRERNPEASVYVLYRDLMTTGFSEAAFTRARAAGMVFIPYRLDRPPRVQPVDGGLAVTVEEPILQRRLQIEAQMVVLATGIVPALPRELAEAYGAHLDPDGFFQEAESKWRPVDSLKEGVFACGLALSPRSITESIATAEAAAQRALRILSREWLVTGKVTAGVRHSLCSLCEQCITACPYGARTLDADLEQVLVNSAMCQGCGACAAVCPNDAAFLEGYRAQQVLAMIEAAI